MLQIGRYSYRGMGAVMVAGPLGVALVPPEWAKGAREALIGRAEIVAWLTQVSQAGADAARAHEAEDGDPVAGADPGLANGEAMEFSRRAHFDNGEAPLLHFNVVQHAARDQVGGALPSIKPLNFARRRFVKLQNALSFKLYRA